MNDRIPGTTYDNPIWYRKYRIYLCDIDAHQFGGYEYAYCHDSYDGAEDAHDRRFGYSKSIDEAKTQIDELEDECA